MEPYYPDVVVNLSGQDGNAFAILARVRVGLRRAGVKYPEVEEFTREAMSGDHDALLRTVMRWVSTT